eukprot:1160653-Pelagomonas_calceolata.AAC.8
MASTAFAPKHAKVPELHIGQKVGTNDGSLISSKVVGSSCRAERWLPHQMSQTTICGTGDGCSTQERRSLEST